MIGGFKFPVGQGTADVGVTWYMYPGGAEVTDFAELYARLSGTVGPVSLVMRGESVPDKTRWIGNPVGPWTEDE